jgi:hypothetical protein
VYTRREREKEDRGWGSIVATLLYRKGVRDEGGGGERSVCAGEGRGGRNNSAPLILNTPVLTFFLPFFPSTALAASIGLLQLLLMAVFPSFPPSFFVLPSFLFVSFLPSCPPLISFPPLPSPPLPPLPFPLCRQNIAKLHLIQSADKEKNGIPHESEHGNLKKDSVVKSRHSL